ncbi:type I secretion system permease/ATPase [Klebsiella sp. RHBSTW-00484]|uniref:type I secretion system permease/ATPase n=1 Tax=unclassified Klebsiella TaxID=2608929 RepID=UPI0015E51326|nr:MULTISPECIES: type I secretion system permease/ATPase [unclassified Klebsiella]MBA7843120.1 type I secretion system permease/ATPase [Klebsiella sp. RHBSTW-00465]QLO38502.1 type I secretion system permease/ATPase [Klebsiella sp. RHBSTW-00484]QLT78022.1 type I secretion system permease/ATPase [Klebsiella sp. RHBSTW-00464]
MSSLDKDVWRGFNFIARYYGIAVNIPALQEQFAVDELHDTTVQFVRAVRHVGLKCKRFRRLQIKGKMVFPALLELPDTGYVILLAAREGEWLIQRDGQAAPEIFTPEPGVNYSGFLFARRFSLERLNTEFNLRWFADAFWRYKKLIGEVLLASFFIQLLALVTPLFFQVVVDKVLAHQSLTTLDVLALGMLFVALFDVILDGLRSYQLAHTSQRIDATLSSLLYRHLLALPLTWFLQRQAGVIVARVHELKTVREFLTGSALTLCLDLLFTLVFFAVMALYSVPLTLIVMASLIPYIILSIVITPILRKRLDEQFKQGARNQAFLVESLTGMESVKALAVENLMTRRWDEQIATFVTSCFKTQNLGNIAGQISRFVSKITSVAILWYGAHLVIEAKMTVGALIAFNMFAGQVTAPVLRLVQLWQDFQQVSVSVKRLGDILNVPTEHQENSSSLAEVKGAIRLANVAFTWQTGSAPVIDGVNLSVRPGEIIGIAGRSGSGKSTLTRLIQRLCIPGCGQIFVDGIDIAQVDPHWLRRQIGVVLQETQLFSGTIRDNIALAVPEASLESVIHAATLAGAHEFISEFPLGYDTPVGEQGGRLSGGQKQRLGIARALMSDPRVLIFDEATSALDYESEEIIQRNMVEICRNRTVFIIAHRLSALRPSHRIIVMEKGRIVEQGSHHQLLEDNGLYSRLHAIQEKSV